MSKNAIAFLVVVLVAIIGATAAVVYRKSTTEPDLDDQISTTKTDTTTDPSTAPSTNQNTVSATVSYDGSNFSPRTLVITSGETVTFVNNSKHQMWVASDPHPVHTDLSSFDARKGFAAGQTYSYTFEKAGIFSFHDHLNSDARGLITVQD